MSDTKHPKEHTRCPLCDNFGGYGMDKWIKCELCSAQAASSSGLDLIIRNNTAVIPIKQEYIDDYNKWHPKEPKDES